MSYKGILRKGGIVCHENYLEINKPIYGQNVGGVAPYANSGTRFFVDKRVTASGSGGTWEGAYKTIAEAITAAAALVDWAVSPWAIGNEIHIAPGAYAENLTSLPHGCFMIGHGDCWDADGEVGVKVKPASGAPVDVGAFVNAAVHNIGFESADTSRVFDATILNNVVFNHCRFAGAPEATTSTCGLYFSDSVMLTVRDSRFEYLDCGIDAVYADGGDSFTRAHIEGNFMTYISEAGVRVSANLVTPASKIIKNFIFGGGITLAVGIDDNSGQDNIGVFGNYIDATDAIQGITTNVGGNYVGGSSIE